MAGLRDCVTTKTGRIADCEQKKIQRGCRTRSYGIDAFAGGAMLNHDMQVGKHDSGLRSWPKPRPHDLTRKGKPMRKAGFGWVALAIVAFFLQGGATPAFSTNIAFEFNVNGVLPSAQGATYVTGPPGPSVLEATVFSTSGGLLHQDTTGGYGVIGRYDVAGVFDHTYDGTLEWSAKAFVNTYWGMQIILQDDGILTDFVLSNSAVFLHNGSTFQSIVSMNTTDEFHDYKVVIPANSPNLEFFVDGALRYSGQTAAAPQGSLLLWGDGSPTAGNAKVDWDYVRLSNSATPAIPEPSTITLVAAGIVGLVVLRKRKPRITSA
jgi:hypothetical protein